MYKQLLLYAVQQKMSNKMLIFKKEILYNSIMLHLLKLYVFFHQSLKNVVKIMKIQKMNDGFVLL